MADTDKHDELVSEQVDYYRARAGEYDEWFLRQGRYDHGPELNQQWFDEVKEVRAQLNAFRPAGRVLELACGTGLWTERLLQRAAYITAVDAADEVLAINQARLQSSRVKYVKADIFEWRPIEPYDMVFFGFWLSHVPPERFEAFWELVGASLAPDGRVFFVDSRYEPSSTAIDHQLEGAQSTTVTRRLSNGHEFRIVKVLYQADELTNRLARLGWSMRIDETAGYFIYGRGEMLAR